MNHGWRELSLGVSGVRAFIVAVFVVFAVFGSGFHSKPPSLPRITMVPAPLITGTIVYLIIAAVLYGAVFGATAVGSLSKDNGE